MKVVCFGASVTAQSTNHSTGEVTGYVDALISLYHSENSSVEFSRIAAGSSHFNEAGFLLFDTVLESNPDIVIFDWHTTSSDVWNQKLVDAVYWKIKQSTVYFLIAIFPRRTNIANGTVPFSVKQIEKYSTLANLDILNFYGNHDIGIHIASYLRDEVHTNSLGAVAYAKEIKKVLDAITPKLRFSSSEPRHSSIGSERNPTGNQSPSHAPGFDTGLAEDRLKIQSDRLQLLQKIRSVSFSIMPDKSFGELILVFHHTVGPFSPVVLVKSDSGMCLSKSLWDPYCHYSRKTFQKVFSGHTINLPCATFTIEIVSHLPDYSTCRRDYDFSSVTERYMDIDSIYVIGGRIKLLHQDLLH